MAHSWARIRRFAKTNKLYRLYLIPVLCPAFCCAAIETPKQITQYVQTALTTNNGLPQNSVGAVTQTRYGYIWFGTQEGIGRYDGLRITVFDTANHRKLKDNFIETLAPARDGSLWVGTRSTLSLLKDGEFQVLFTSQSPISSILEARDGRIWVGSMDGLYAVKGTAIRRFTVKDGLPSNAIERIVET